MRSSFYWIVTVILVCGAYYLGTLRSQQKSVTTRIHEDIFERKRECQQYNDKIMAELESDQFVTEALYRVFYSPSRNSCLSAKYVLYPKKEGELLQIDDILTGATVWTQSYAASMKYWEAHIVLDQQISTLEQAK